MDTGSKVIGSAVITNGKVVYQAETQIRQDVSKKVKQRAMKCKDIVIVVVLVIVFWEIIERIF